MNFVQFSDIYLSLLIVDDLQYAISFWDLTKNIKTEMKIKLLIIVEIF